MDAKAKTANRALCKDDDEYEWAKKHVAQNRDRWEDPGAWWRSGQDGLRKKLGEQQAELELVRTKSGRFQGMSDEQVVESEEYFRERIDELVKFMADENEEAHIERLVQEARVKAALVDEDIRTRYEERKKEMNKGISDESRWRFFP